MKSASRATDICTCKKARDEHLGEDHEFFPHPQPNSTARPRSIEDRVVDFLEGLGEVRPSFKKDSFLLQTLEGEQWEISVVKRSLDEEEIQLLG